MTDQNIWVCTDCYFAHHYGFTEHEGKFYAGDTDIPADREPLLLLVGLNLFGNTCSNHYYGQDHVFDQRQGGDPLIPCAHCGNADWENGIDDFSWRPCEGCGSTLGGSRFRLHWEEP